MIVGYFGLPGCGKTTLLTMKAQKALSDIARGVSKYKYVFTNFECAGCHKITFMDLDSFTVKDSLILLDELVIDADNRGFKQFPLGIRDFLILHRHESVDVIYATQAYDKVDLKIRVLTAELWYMRKTVIPILSSFTLCTKIYRNMDINEYTSDIVYGYRFCNFVERFFASNNQLIWRPRYYKYFDSFDSLQLAQRKHLPIIPWGTPFVPSKLDHLIAKAPALFKFRAKSIH